MVLQGFTPASEDRRVSVAMANRDAWIMKMMREQTGLDEKRLSFKASHATTHDALSRLSIVTFDDPSIAALAARSMSSKRFNYDGHAVSFKKQQTA